MTTSRSYRPVALIILDGWGESERPIGNAVAAGRTPNLDRWRESSPRGILGASGLDVGLKPGQMGDSNVGHLNLGAGRVVYQDLVRIDQALKAGDFAAQPGILRLAAHVNAHDSVLHLMGLVSDGGVHSHIDHLGGLLAVAAEQGVRRLRVHAFLDGRDVPPRSAAAYLSDLDELLRTHTAPGRDWALATIAGRYYAMDRDKRWERTQAAYEAVIGAGPAGGIARGASPGAVMGDAFQAQCEVAIAATQAANRDAGSQSWHEALAAAYGRGESDEFVRPVRLARALPVGDDDGVLLFNFRADRARQLTQALIAPKGAFTAFARPPGRPQPLVLTMTRYDARFATEAVFKPQDLSNTLGAVVAAAGLRQLRLAETEKYAHVTFFLSGGREEPFAGEDRSLVPSPAVATYDLQPEMSAPEVSQRAVAAVKSQRYDLLVVNFANGDMVGHTGVFAAAVTAVEAVDAALCPLVDAILAAGGAALIVSDHGNAETMLSPVDGSPHTAHTSNPVPALLIAPGLPSGASLRPGVLADVAPTVLQLLGLEPPPEMTGRSLLV